jgi:hypothetical protein
MKLKMEKFLPLGLRSFRMEGIEIYTLDSGSKSLHFEYLYVSRRLNFFPPKIHNIFRMKIDGEREFVGDYHYPVFSDFTFFQKRSSINAVAGDLDLRVVKVPMHYVLRLFANDLSQNLTKNIKGDITGTVKIRKKYPYDLSASQAILSIEWTDVRVTIPSGGNQKLDQTIVLKPFETSLSFKQGVLTLNDPLFLSSAQTVGSVQLNGGVTFSGSDGKSPEISAKISGESELFIFFKQFLHCPKESKNVSIRGFKIVSCS